MENFYDSKLAAEMTREYAKKPKNALILLFILYIFFS